MIVNQIRTTNSTFSLSSGDITLLQTNGVSQNVIIEMQNRRARTVIQSQPVYVRDPYYPRRPYYRGGVYITP